MTTTEAGTALWPMLDEADKKYGLPGNYNIKLRLSAEHADSLVISIDKIATERLELARDNAADKSAFIGLAQPPYKRQPDGSAVFVFRMSAERKGKSGKVRQAPEVVDANGKSIAPHLVTSGSPIRVTFAAMPFHNGSKGIGVSLKLIQVQLLDTAVIEAAA
jgi:hypothetical protein